MLLTVNNYADFVSATKALDTEHTVIYFDNQAGGGGLELLSISREEKAYVFFNSNPTPVIPISQIQSDFPDAVALTAGFAAPTVP
jgi:hypothetical protein